MSGSKPGLYGHAVATVAQKKNDTTVGTTAESVRALPHITHNISLCSLPSSPDVVMRPVLRMLYQWTIEYDSVAVWWFISLKMLTFTEICR